MDASVFSVADRRADTAIGPGALSLAKDTTLQYGGVVVGSTVRAPVADYVAANGWRARQRGDARWLCSRSGGEAEAQAPRELPAASMALVPFVQETFGRLGPAARAFLRQVASHSAAAQGGHTKVIERRAGTVSYTHLTLPTKRIV